MFYYLYGVGLFIRRDRIIIQEKEKEEVKKREMEIEAKKIVEERRFYILKVFILNNYKKYFWKIYSCIYFIDIDYQIKKLFFLYLKDLNFLCICISILYQNFSFLYIYNFRCLYFINIFYQYFCLQIIKDDVRKVVEEEKIVEDVCDVLDFGDENDEEEYEVWKVRELRRLKRDKEEREKQVILIYWLIRLR